MDKLKKVFSPGHSKDDEVMYGTPSKEGASATDPTHAPPSSTLATNPDADSKDKGVLRQIFNPGGDKYSEQSYGTTATTADPSQASQSNELQTTAEGEKKDKGVFRQIFNPGGDKYSEQSYGTTASTDPTMADQLQKEPATSEPLKGAETAQHNNDNVQQEPYGSTSASSYGTTTAGPSTMAREDNQDDVSNATYTARSYALGSGSSTGPQQTSSNVDQATRATNDLGSTGEDPSRVHQGRRLDHSLAGAGTGGAGAGYVNPQELDEFMKHGRDDEADQATYRARDYYVGSSSEADPFNRPGHELSGSNRAPGGIQSASETSPGHIPGEFPTEDGGDPHSSSSGIGTGSAAAAGLGAGAGAGAAGVAASKAYNDRSAAAPSTQSGSAASPSAAQSSAPIQTTTNTMRSGSSSAPKQDTTTDPKAEEKEKSGGFKGALAAATAAMGLGGAGAYAASRDDKDDAKTKPTESTSSPQTSRAVGSSNVAPGSVVSDKTQSYAGQRPGETSTGSNTTARSQAPEQDDHTARNAALGASALGATGAGAYALGRDRDSTEPQSSVSNQTQSYAGTRPSDTTSSALPTSAAPAASQPQARQQEDDNTARNAALGAGGLGAAGAGAYALGRDDKDSPSTANSGTAQSVVSEKTQSYARHHPSDTDPSLRSTGTTAPSTTTQPSTAAAQPREEDHTARNAALGAGGIGAAGAGAYALSNRDNDRNTGDAAQSVVSPETQKYSGSHPSDSNPAYQSSTTTSTPATQRQQTTTQPQQSEDHTARNAALGAGALGATGAGAYALSNRDDNNTGNAQSVVSPETQKYSGSHPSDTNPDYQGSRGPISSSQPISQSQPTTQSQSSEDHTARNAALGAGGLGAAGAGAYALSRDDKDPGRAQSVVSPETQKYSGSHPSDTNPDFQSRGPISSSQPISQSEPTSRTQPDEDHTARNAALGAGGLGAAGAGAYALSRDDKDPGAAQSVVSPATQKYSGSHPGDANPAYQSSTTTSAAQPQTSSYQQPPTTSSYQQPSTTASTQQRPQEEDHTARNAALGAGAVGAAGAGAYYLSRDDDPRAVQSGVPPDTQRYTEPPRETTRAAEPTPTKTQKPEKVKEAAPVSKSKEPAPVSKAREPEPVPASRPVDTREYDRTAARPQEEDHTARNAALGAGGLGAAGAGAYALSRDDDKPSTQAPMSSQPTRSYGYPSDRQDDSTTEDMALGAGSSGSGSRSAAQPQQEDHTARNAALGAGGVGAAGAGAYALSRDDTGPASKTIGPHESNAANVMDPRVKPEPTQQFEKTTAGPHNSNIANKMDPRVTSDPAKAEQKESEQGHNYGRDAAIAGGAGAAGAAGYGAYEYAHRDKPSQEYSSQQSSDPYAAPHEKYDPPQRQYAAPAAGESSSHDNRVVSGSDGHNKLHKKGVDTEPQQQEEDHTGRNAALGVGAAGAAGAAGYGAKEHYDSKHDTESTGSGGEKKHGLLHKILHPREHKREKQEEEERRRSSDNRRSYDSPRSSGAAAASPTVATGPSGTQAGEGGMAREPHTGLPIDLSKGVGSGGTDGATQIEGYHAGGAAPGQSGVGSSGQGIGRPY